jgi:hypothetical protein
MSKSSITLHPIVTGLVCREILQDNHCDRGAREGGAWLALPIDLRPSLARRSYCIHIPTVLLNVDPSYLVTDCSADDYRSLRHHWSSV